MPTYDYKCSSCGNIFEKFHGMNESPEVLCPKCNAISKKQIGLGAGIVFKGSGFYVNDYKKKDSSSKQNSSKEKSQSNKNKPIEKTGSKENKLEKKKTTASK